MSTFKENVIKTSEMKWIVKVKCESEIGQCNTDNMSQTTCEYMWLRATTKC